MLKRMIKLMTSFTVTYKDDDTYPDLIQQLAKHHGIPPEALIKRFISQGLSQHFPPKRDISEYDNLDDLLKRGNYKK
jgi:NH3-dependent NAD+ synthetase